MSKLDGRVNKLERTDTSREALHEEMSEHERSILEHLAMVELSVCPDLELVTEADTDPETLKEIQRTLAEARGEFEPKARRETPLDAKSAPRLSAPRKQRSGPHREVDAESLVEALDFIDKAIAASGDAVARSNRAVSSTRERLGKAPPAEP